VSPYNFRASGNILIKLFLDDVPRVRDDKMGISLGRPAPKIWEGKKTSKIRRNFWQLSTLIANISGKDQRIANPKSILSTTSPSKLDEKNLVNFGPQTKEL